MVSAGVIIGISVFVFFIFTIVLFMLFTGGGESPSDQSGNITPAAIAPVAGTPITVAVPVRTTIVMKDKRTNIDTYDTTIHAVDTAEQCGDACIDAPECLGWTYIGANSSNDIFRKTCMLNNKIARFPKLVAVNIGETDTWAGLVK